MEQNAEMTCGEKTTPSSKRSPRQQLGRVVNRRELSHQFVWIELEVGGFAGAVPGQFVVVRCADESDYVAGLGWEDSGDWPRAKSAELRNRVALVGRPFSIADMSEGADGSRIALQFRVLGPGTSWLAEKSQVGAQLRLVGPLGNGFRLEGVGQAVLAAGGMGLAPMLFLARQLRGTGSRVVVLAGAKSREVLPLDITEGALIDEEGEPSLCCEAFSELDVKVGIATDDGSAGRLGQLSDSLADYLSRHRELCQTGSVVYTCGPEAMMNKVSQIAQVRQLPCEVCMERYMACGLGTCQSCVCRQRSEGSEDGWEYKLVCKDGPVFDGQSILW